LATITKIESFTHESESQDKREGKRVKLVVYLTVTKEGAERIKEKIREWFIFK